MNCVKINWARFDSANSLLTLNSKDLLKTCNEKLFLWLTLLLCICWSFPFRRKIYGRRVFKYIMQCDWFAVINVLCSFI